MVAEGVSKNFRIPRESRHTLKERLLHPRRRSGVDELRALDDLSFEVGSGEFFGIVGRNGSGKSTLLKCLAGIYGTDAGRLRIAGRLSPFIELGVGFNPDLAAHDNVVLNAIMLGLSPQEARRRVDEVIAFAELEEFVDLKIKNYSSGMHVRLAFAVMVQVEADILLIDEVLAVGDAAFQQKCFDEFHRMRRAGRTVLFVTHSMRQVEHFCDRAMLLDRGKLVSIGDPGEIAMLYNELNFGRGSVPAGTGSEEEERPGDRSIEVEDLFFEDATGERIAAVAQGERCRVIVKLRAQGHVTDPVIALELLNEDGERVFATNSNWLERSTGEFRPGERATFVVNLEFVFAPGRYSPVGVVLHSGSERNLIDRRASFPSVLVHGVRVGGGLVDLPHDVALERGQAQVGVGTG